ncbi:General stress protein 18 [Flammeovirgaceae bacterium 311]|nr:General stress protein 18 [Flammeovirgaceae bacterium 311]
MTRARLIQRLKWYYPAEKFHTYFTVPVLLIYVIYSYPIQDIIFIVYGLVVCTVILYQGQLYWKLKLNSLKGENINQEKNIVFFKKSKKLNIYLIGLMPLFLLLQLTLQEWKLSINVMLYWGILSNAFAVLEYINYYHLQLMVDNKYDIEYIIRNKKLKKASLAKDLMNNKI